MISTTRIAPVGNVLHKSARATFPPASRSAMMPEPTTAASKNAVPRNSAPSLCARRSLTMRDARRRASRSDRFRQAASATTACRVMPEVGS